MSKEINLYRLDLSFWFVNADHLEKFIVVVMGAAFASTALLYSGLDASHII